MRNDPLSMTGRWRRWITAAAATATIALTACTPAQIDGWLSWYQRDPDAAIEYANRPEIQLALAPPPRPVHVTGWSVDWNRVARCESGGNWSMHVHTSNGWFGGGLAIMDSAWRNFGGLEFAPHAGLASKTEQIIVAERIVADVGFDRAWQCHA